MKCPLWNLGTARSEKDTKMEKQNLTHKLKGRFELQ